MTPASPPQPSPQPAARPVSRPIPWRRRSLAVALAAVAAIAAGAIALPESALARPGRGGPEAPRGRGAGGSCQAGNCPVLDGTGAGSATADAETQRIMAEAIADEYRARAVYRAAIAKFGPVRPFSQIVRAEDRHVQLWETLFARYGVPVPADTFAGNVSVPDTLAATCQVGVEAERADAAMYDRFLETTTQPDLRAAFEQLRRVSRERHLPAFQRCSGG